MTFGNLGNPGGRYPQARYTIVDKKARELSFLPSIMHTSSSSARESRSRRLHAAAVFFYFIYINLDVIGTCMQFFKNIEGKKTQNF